MWSNMYESSPTYVPYTWGLVDEGSYLSDFPNFVVAPPKKVTRTSYGFLGLKACIAMSGYPHFQTHLWICVCVSTTVCMWS